MEKPVRVVHYLNQFFGGIGGEERAQTPLEVREGPVGPGRALQQALGAEGTVVATLVCGDDYVAEREEAAGASMREALQRYQPDLVIAGPAFDSGRYGLGCALACRVARSLGIPAVTGMYDAAAGLSDPALEEGAPVLLVQRAPGHEPGSAYDIAHGATLGRGNVESKLEDPFASSAHARIFARGDSMYIEDLRSTNGTYLNERQLTRPEQLQPSDTIRIGETEYRYQE